eukprot:GEMP01011480.1.p1 GENE.GEMP01011480.1~~GEMP01011480.1.p1  ORF type:complete len:788 (+),score=130.73 GEMP01011480.1:50-2365(+)
MARRRGDNAGFSSCFPVIIAVISVVMVAEMVSLSLFGAATSRRMEGAEEEGEQGESMGPEAQSWTIVALFAVIITLSILFELGQGALYSYFRRNEKHEYIKMFDALFKELTILGFVGLCLMCMVKAGGMTDIARLIAYVHQTRGKHAATEILEGENLEDAAIGRRLVAEEEVDPIVVQLTETFEEIHLVLFGIMICFIALVTILLITAQMTHKKFKASETLNQEEVLREAWGDNWRWWKKFSYVDALLYRLIRREFYYPFDGRRHRGVKPSTFDFPAYLGKCMVEFVVELIEIPPSSFLVLLLVLLGTRRMLLASEENRPYILMAVSWVLFVLLVIALLKLSSIFFLCLPASSPSYFTPLPPLGWRLLGNDTRPRFSNHPLQRCDNRFLLFFLGTSSPTKQERLFWFWSNGPRFLAICIQLLLFLQAVYLAVLFRVGFLEAPLACTVLQFIPFVLGLLFVWPRILFFYTIATSTNLMKSEEIMEEIANHITRMQFRRYESLILELNTHARVHMIKSLPNETYRSWKETQLVKFRTTLSEDVAAEIDAAFDLWDTDKSGRIDEGEMVACLKAQNTPDDSIQGIIDNWFHSGVFRSLSVQQRRRSSAVQKAVSQDLSKEDFEILMVNMHELTTGSCDDEDTELWLKEILDADGNGKVSTDEFIDALPIACRNAALDKEGVEKLFTIIDGCAEEDALVDCVEIAKVVVWLNHFTDAGSRARQPKHGNEHKSATRSHEVISLIRHANSQIPPQATQPSKDEEKNIDPGAENQHAE